MLTYDVTASQRLMTAAIPYLKLGCHPAIIIVGTKNAPAPGKYFHIRMLTYAHECSRMLTYAHALAPGKSISAYLYICMLTYAHVCSHMLTYALVCSRMLPHAE
jgi:hypothetical protein